MGWVGCRRCRRIACVIGKFTEPELQPKFEHGAAVLTHCLDDEIGQGDVASAGLRLRSFDPDAMLPGFLDRLPDFQDATLDAVQTHGQGLADAQTA